MITTTKTMKRVKVKNKGPQNPLFEKWLTEWKEDAASKGSEMQYVFGKALRSLQKYPFKLNSGKECIILENFGTKICYMLDKKLDEYKIDHPEVVNTLNAESPGDNVPDTKKKHAKRKSQETKEDDKSAESDDSPNKRRKTDYVPAYRSGGYAIILTLYETTFASCLQESMTKTEIQKLAQDLCDCSFTQPKDPGSFYTAWSSMKTLLTKELVTKKGNPPKFSLTEKGLDLAIRLKTESYNMKTSNSNVSLSPSTDTSKRTSEPKKTTQKTSPSTSSYQNDFEDFPVNTNTSPIAKQKETFKSKKTTSSSENYSDEFSPKKGANTDPIYSYEDDNIQDKGSSESQTAEDAPTETIFLMPNSFEIILLIDFCETENKSSKVTIKQLQSHGVNFEVRKLSVGDFVWICRDNEKGHELVLPYAIERKRMDDLAQSIKDGRFHEQKFRLKQCGLENLIYLVEKYGQDNHHVGLPLPTLQQAACNTQFVDKFNVKITRDHSETVNYLIALTTQITNIYKKKIVMSCKKEDLQSVKVSEDLIGLMTFKEFNKGSRKVKKPTVRNMLFKQLLQLKGMSVEKAMAVIELYPTPKRLMEMLKSPAAEKKIANLTYGPLKRNIGPVLAKTIRQLYTFRLLT